MTAPLHKSFARRWLAPVLIYGFIPVALIAIIWLRDEGLLAQTPLWIMVLTVLMAGVANAGTAMWLARSPQSRPRMHLRIVASVVGTAAVVYAAGWGSMLVIAYALGSAELLRSVGSNMVRPMLGWNYAAILLGEVAVALGWAPSVIDPVLSHSVAVVGTVCLTVVTIVLMSTAQAAERATEHLHERRVYFQELVEHARDVIGDLSPQGRVRQVSPAISGLLGYSPEDVKGLWIGDHLHPDEARHLEQAFAEVIADPGNPHTYEVRVRHRTGSYRNVVATLTGASPGGRPTIIANLHDVTRQRQLEEQLTHDARHDGLTGLLNRRAFTRAAETESSRALARGRAVGVLYIDLDGFKAVNDSFGHDMGDRVLVETARRLEHCVRPGDVLARLGGDEFAVLVTLEDGHGVALRIADRILAELADSIPGLPYDVRIGASIGIAIRSEEGIELSHLIRAADEAMYAAKHEGRARWRLADT